MKTYEGKVITAEKSDPVVKPPSSLPTGTPQIQNHFSFLEHFHVFVAFMMISQWYLLLISLEAVFHCFREFKTCCYRQNGRIAAQRQLSIIHDQRRLLYLAFLESPGYSVWLNISNSGSSWVLP